MLCARAAPGSATKAATATASGTNQADLRSIGAASMDSLAQESEDSRGHLRQIRDHQNADAENDQERHHVPVQLRKRLVEARGREQEIQAHRRKEESQLEVRQEHHPEVN